ncbi:MAG: ABC transporter permease [Proteobacteria bacterium]|nr:ABC transporter permease [Pseudomonadota bacterium]
MALRNIWRNPRRTWLTILAIAFASLLLVFMLSFQFGSYEAMINTSVRISTGHLQVQARGYQKDRNIWQAVNDPNDLATILNSMPDIVAWTFRANAFSLVSSEKRTDGVQITGIEPEREKQVSTLKDLIRKGSYLGEVDLYGALVGDRLARNLGVVPGDSLTVLGQGRDGSMAASVLTVTGVFESGIDAMDRNVLMIRLEDFQEIFFMGGGVHEAVLTVSSLKKVSLVKKELTDRLALVKGLVVLDWMEIMPGLLQSIQMDLVSGCIMYLILVIVVAFSIFNTFLMAIFERTREFGVMMAMGTSPFRLMKLVLIESMAMTLLGIVLGMVLGSLVTLYFQHQGIYIPGTEDIFKQYGIPDRLFPRLSLLTLTAGPGLVFCITFISSVFPALKLRKMKPVEAMSHV